MSLCVTTRVGKSHNADHFGNYEIVSNATVSKESVPGAYMVVLQTRRDLCAISKTVSADDGSYRFRYLNGSSQFVLIAFDHGASPSSPGISDTPVLTPMAFDF